MVLWVHKSNSIGGGVVWGCNKPERLYNFSSLWFNVVASWCFDYWRDIVTLWPFKKVSHNNVMSESQTWDNNALFMFQCEGSNSHIETYKSCISAWVIISFLDFHCTTIYHQFCVWIIFAILTTVPVRMLRIKFLLVFCDMLNHVLNLTSPKCM